MMHVITENSYIQKRRGIIGDKNVYFQCATFGDPKFGQGVKVDA